MTFSGKLSLCAVTFALMAAPAPCQTTRGEALKPIRPGNTEHHIPFWNRYAARFIYPPTFEIARTSGAATYHFVVQCGNDRTVKFDASDPEAPLTPVWKSIPEGLTTLTVTATDASGTTIGSPSIRVFYRSPSFPGHVTKPAIPYATAGQRGLKALYEKEAVQHWLVDGKPDPGYDRYCYPNKIMGALVRAMTAYSKQADNPEDSKKALEIARRCADYLFSIRAPENFHFAFIPPTYFTAGIHHPTHAAVDRSARNWFMVPSSVDSAFGFLDLYDATKDTAYLDAGKRIADTLKKTQEADGTWPLMADFRTGKPKTPQRMVPTWVIFLFDRLNKQYHLSAYQDARMRAWNWIVAHPLKTWQWDGQFEDVKPRPPYRNLAREQACDVAMLLLEKGDPASVAQAEKLLRFAEDQFVVWTPVRDPSAWHAAMPDRRKRMKKWITPCVLEQYACYGPVARSSAILINAWVKAWQVTGKAEYLSRARALANGLVKGQEWLTRTHHGNGEFPTWNMRSKPINWLNNSFYAADAVSNLARVLHDKSH